MSAGKELSTRTTGFTLRLHHALAIRQRHVHVVTIIRMYTCTNPFSELLSWEKFASLDQTLVSDIECFVPLRWILGEVG